MYETILVTLDTTPTDRAIIDHIKALAKVFGSRVVLLHVLDGWSARHFGSDTLSEEVEEDRGYLEKVRAEFAGAGIEVTVDVAYGEPAKEIVKWIRSHPCDLVAMSTHGHTGVADFLYGKTAIVVQHEIFIPVLLLRAKPE